MVYSLQFRRNMSDCGQTQYDDLFLLRWLRGKNINFNLSIFWVAYQFDFGC
jgi:hypothetical protein